MSISSRIRSKTWAGFLAVIVSGASLIACGGSSDEEMDKAIKSLNSYYVTHAPPRGWSVKHIASDEDHKLRIDMLIDSHNDVNLIKSRSRMDQFTIAKLGCPKANQALKETIHGKTRVWVRLITKTEELTLSICPKF